MVRVVHSLALLCGLLALIPAPVCAEEADKAAQVFESLYGNDFRRVRLTRDTKDDLELAKRLVAAAKEAVAQPEFLAVLCNKACDLAAAHPEGIDTAREALDLLASEVPEEACPCAERMAAIRQKQYDAARGDAKAPAGETLIEALLAVADGKRASGDLVEATNVCRRAQMVARAVKSDRQEEIDARLKGLAQSMKAARDVEDLKALLDKDPRNTSVREKLVRTYLVDLDRPDEAAGYLEGVQDASLAKYLPAVAKGVQAAPELACMELGEWYRTLGEAAPAGSKAAMFARAKAYYDRFLDLHAAEDLNRTAAGLALRKITAALDKLGGPPPVKAKPGKPAETPQPLPGAVKEAPSPAVPAAPPAAKTLRPGLWFDVLALVDPEKDAVKGTWRRQDKALAVEPVGHGRIMIPVAPEGSYELRASFVRQSGNESVDFILPVGSSSVAVVLSGGGGAVSGLSCVNGKEADLNEAKVSPGRLENGHEYRAECRVIVQGNQAMITVTLDGQPYIMWSGLQSALSVPGMKKLPDPTLLGLGAFGSNTVFRRVDLRLLSGTARQLRSDDAAGRPAAGVTVVKPGEWVDLLAPIDLEKDVLAGAWERQGGSVRTPRSVDAARVAIPVSIEGGYELQARFVRNATDLALGVVLPVGATNVDLVLSGWVGKQSGLQLINGKGADPTDGTAVPCALENGREYTLGAKVVVQGGQAEIAVTLDRAPYLSWKGPAAALAGGLGWQVPQSDRPALAANGEVEFRSVRLRMLSGQARVLRPPAAPNPATAPPPPDPVRPGGIVLRARDAAVHGDGASYERNAGRDNIGGWRGVDTWVSWEALIDRPGAYVVEAVYALDEERGGGTFRVSVGDEALEHTVEGTGGWTKFVAKRLGTVNLRRTGLTTVAVKPVRFQGEFLVNLQAVCLTPSK